MGRLSGSASFLGGKWGEAGIDATSVTYALLRDGRLVGRLRYFEVDWAAGSVDRLGDPGDGTAEILVTLSKSRARYVIEGGAREVLRPLHDGLVATVPVRVRWREAGWAMYALEALMAGQ